MTGNRISPAVERLIDDLGSVGTLELLLLLREARPEPKRRDAICAALRCPEQWADLQLSRLREAELVDGDTTSGFVYAPRSSAHAADVDEIARLWEADRRRITSRMLAPASLTRGARFGPR